MSRDVPFRQPQQLQHLHHGSTNAYLGSPLGSIPFSTVTKVKIYSMHFMASAQGLL